MAEKKTVAFALYPGVAPLDLIGPLTPLRKVGLGWPFRTVVVAKRVEAMDSNTPLRMVPAATFADEPSPFALIVPGGGAATVRAMRDGALLAYVRRAAETAEVVGSTGNGALVLAAAGLLNGRRAAVHWAYRELLESLGAVPATALWVEDGQLLTAAGGTAGIDAMLRLLAKVKGEAGSKLAQLGTEYDPEPPFGGIDRTNVDAELAAVLGAPRAR
jgi:transcriptional regulator GlxA family with amidase domain